MNVFPSVCFRRSTIVKMIPTVGIPKSQDKFDFLVQWSKRLCRHVQYNVAMFPFRIGDWLWKAAFLVGVILIGPAPLPAWAAPPSAPSLATAYELIDAVNAYRAQNGLPPYSVNPTLMQLAQSHAEYMASIGVVTHTGPGGTSYRDRLTAAGYAFSFASENILGTSANLTGWEIVTSPYWADPDHQYTMLSPNLREIGAGVAKNNGRWYYVIDCATPKGSGGSASPPSLPSSTAAPPSSGTIRARPVTVIPNTPLPDGAIKHLVRPGETLWAIAIAYQTTVAQLKTYNRLTSNTIYPGMTLIIVPPAPTLTPTLTPTETSRPTVTPFLFRTSTPTSSPTSTPLSSPAVDRRSGSLILGLIVGSSLILAGALAALSARKPLASHSEE